MEGLEEKLNSILNNPEMMQKVMSMAQSFQAPAPQQENQKDPAPPPGLPDIDIGMLQKFSGLAKQGTIDKEQQALLRALNPYLSRQRIAKLENAMRAARMARIAVSTIGQQGPKFSSSR